MSTTKEAYAQVRDNQGTLVGSIVEIDATKGEIVIGSATDAHLYTRFPAHTLAAVDDDRCTLPCAIETLSWSVHPALHSAALTN